MCNCDPEEIPPQLSRKHAGRPCSQTNQGTCDDAEAPGETENERAIAAVGWVRCRDCHIGRTKLVTL